MDGHVVSPFNLSRTLPVGGGLLVPYSLSGSPVIKQLMQMVTMVLGPGWAVSISVLPLTTQMVTLAGLFFAETDILTTQGKDQTQRPQLGPFCPWSPPDTDNWPECPAR